MNVAAVKSEIKSLINTNASTLVTGITEHGQARTIAHITTSVLTPATAYYFLGVHCEETTEHSKDGSNAQKPPRWTDYNVLVHIEDYAQGTVGEDELYETVHGNFDKFVDRVADLIENANWIGTSPRFRLVRSRDQLSDRIVIRSDALQTWYDEAEAFHAMLTAQLRFRLAQECVDRTQLYA